MKMSRHHTALKFVAASLAGFAFFGSAMSQEAPYVAGKYSANTERLWDLGMEPAQATPVEPTTSENETTTFAYDDEVLRFPRPRFVEDPVFGNYSANVRAHDLR
jgi:hypothetical protein